MGVIVAVRVGLSMFESDENSEIDATVIGGAAGNVGDAMVKKRTALESVQG